MENTAFINAVAIKLPEFYTHNPKFWFISAESQFLLRGITADDTKYAHVVASLPAEVSERVMDVLEEPPEENKYENLRTALCEAYSRSEAERAASLLDMQGLGDRTPSQLLVAMRNTLKPKDSEALYRELFLRQLPTEVRQQLLNRKELPLDKLAKEADNFFNNQGQRICAARFAPAKRDSKETDPPLCFFHQKFGKKARKCREPCSFQPLN